MDRLKGKVAIITGAASGMGRAEAAVFAQEGAKVVMTDNNHDLLDKAAQELKEQGLDVLPMYHEVSQQSEWVRVVQDTMKAHGKIDILVNNAGIGPGKTNLKYLDVDRWKLVLGVQLWGPVFGMNQVYPIMKAQGGGVILNVCSLASYSAMAGANPYTAAKSAMVGLTRAAASDFAKDNIRVNAITPGIIITKLMGDVMDDLEHPWMVKEGARIKLKTAEGKPRFGDPKDAAYAMVYYASDEASYITGTILPVDGGYMTF